MGAPSRPGVCPNVAGGQQRTKAANPRRQRNAIREKPSSPFVAKRRGPDIPRTQVVRPARAGRNGRTIEAGEAIAHLGPLSMRAARLTRPTACVASAGSLSLMRATQNTNGRNAKRSRRQAKNYRGKTDWLPLGQMVGRQNLALSRPGFSPGRLMPREEGRSRRNAPKQTFEPVGANISERRPQRQ